LNRPGSGPFRPSPSRSLVTTALGLLLATFAGCDAGAGGTESPASPALAAADPARPAAAAEATGAPASPGYRSRAELLAAVRRDGELSPEAVEALGRELARLDASLPPPATGRPAATPRAPRADGIEVARSAVQATGALYYLDGWAWGNWIQPALTPTSYAFPAVNGAENALEYSGYGDWEPGPNNGNAKAFTWYAAWSKFRWYVHPGFYRGWYNAGISPGEWYSDDNMTAQNQFGLVATIYQGTESGWVPIYQNVTYPNLTNVSQGTPTEFSTQDLFHPNTGYLFVVSSYCSADPGGWRSGSFQVIAL
jgi:hypothetical protein